MARIKAGFRRKDTQRALDNAPTGGSSGKAIARTNDYGLTEKQEAFARLVAKGSTLADAYRASYNAEEMTSGTIYTESSKLMDNPRVAARVRALIEDANERHLVDAARVRRHVMDRLLRESVDMESPASARISALVALGRVDVVGMFKEHKGEKDKVDDDPDRLKAKLRKMLEEMTGVAPPIKGD